MSCPTLLQRLVLPLLSSGAILAAAAFWQATFRQTPLPSDQIGITHNWADESTCITCHVQAQDFWSTGHAQTLRPATAERSLDLLQQLRQPGLKMLLPAAPTVPPDPSEDRASAPLAIDESNSPAHKARLNWCFGSGAHACTWVGLLPDSWGMTDALEFRWSWYRETDSFGLTPGHLSQSQPGYFQNLGILFDQPKARHCFACHASVVPVSSGHIEESAIQPGVTCQRCHGPLANHVVTDGAALPKSLKGLNRDESVRRCAQCHRAADEQKLEEIRPDHAELIRFQPVGLEQSACFQSSPEMSCTTCHNPHLPLRMQDARGIWQCLQCHDPSKTNQTRCGAGQINDCLTCHMPQVSLKAPLKFTDHWIRLPDQKRAAP